MSEPGALPAAIAALRAGRPVRISGLTLLSVETATADMVRLLDPDANADLLISGQRAAALGLANEAAAGDCAHPVRIVRPDWLCRKTARTLADPALDFDRPPLGPLKPINAPDEGKAAIQLARLSGLLPALWIVESDDVATTLDAADLDVAPKAEKVAQAGLPLDDLPSPQIQVYRDSATGEEHVALILGSFGGEPPLVRLHSECLTGDVFGSLKCDCGPQLQAALRLIAAAGGGVLLYLRQEGRGIGLANKIRAYGLQDRGLDTVDANRRLGFADDARDYRMAAAILRAMNVEEVRLLTNNPNKVAGLEAEGVSVTERVAHHMPTNPHNADYIATKKARSGHLD